MTGSKTNRIFWVKLALVLLLALAIPALGIVEQVYMKDSFDELCGDCREIIALLSEGDDADAYRKTLDMKARWEKTRDMLEFMYPNADIKEVAPQIGELQGDLEADLADDAIARARMIESLAENSKNLLAFKWKNIL